MSDDNSTSDWVIGVDTSEGSQVSVDTSGVLNLNFSNYNTSPAISFNADSNTGFYRVDSNTISIGPIKMCIGGKEVSMDIVLDYLEQAYMLNRITKDELVAHLTEYHQSNGLDIVESIEKIEQAKETFYSTVLHDAKELASK